MAKKRQGFLRLREQDVVGRKIKIIEYEPAVPVNGADTGYVFLSANSISKKSVSNFPSKHRRVVSLVFADGVNNFWCRHFWLGSANYSWFYGASLIIPAAMRGFFSGSLSLIEPR